MDHRTEPPLSEAPAPALSEQSATDTSVASIAHPVLSRLLEEVRNRQPIEASYDRVHNRHNRGR